MNQEVKDRGDAVEGAPCIPAEGQESGQAPTTIIEVRQGWRMLDLAELWRYRELLLFLAWRDVAVRYKQTLLGMGWAVLQPTLLMIVFTIFLGRIARVPSGGVPYPLFVYTGLLPWTFFASAITNAGNSVVQSEGLITKVYFPRLLVPFGAAMATLVDFLIAFGMLLVLMVFYGVWPSWTMLLVPLAVVLILFAGLGIGVLLAAVNVAYRDVRHVIPFLIQLWMFATPIIYLQAPPSSPNEGADASPARHADEGEGPAVADGNAAGRQAPVPEGLGAITNCNLMTGLVSFFRAAVLGGPLPWGGILWSLAIALPLGIGGCYYFRRVEDTFADLI